MPEHQKEGEENIMGMTREEALKKAYIKKKDTAGEERDFLNTVIEALEQESTYYPLCIDCNKKMDEIRRAYDKLKEQEPKIGHWIQHEEKMFISAEHWECSWCHRTTMIYPFRVDGNDYDAMYYCPKCGAKMQGVEE